MKGGEDGGRRAEKSRRKREEGGERRDRGKRIRPITRGRHGRMKRSTKSRIVHVIHKLKL